MRSAAARSAAHVQRFADHVARDEGDVRGALSEAAHEIRIPLLAEGYVDTHPIALPDERLLKVAAHAVQHLELESVLLDPLLLCPSLRLVDHRRIVRGDPRVVPPEHERTHALR